MIIASDQSSEGTGLNPVSWADITSVERLIHNSTFDDDTKTDMERRIRNVEFREELYEIIGLLKENQIKNLNEQLDDALRRAT